MDFIIDIKTYRLSRIYIRLSNSQKDFLLRCIEQNITEDLSKKEMARRVNGWNFSRSVDGILEILGKDSLFDIISEFNIVKELKPENAIKTEFGYKTNKNIKRLVKKLKII